MLQICNLQLELSNLVRAVESVVFLSESFAVPDK